MSPSTALLKPWLEPLGIFLGAAAGGWLIKVFILRRLGMFFKREESGLDELLLPILNRHLPLWFMLAGLSAAAPASPLGAGQQAWLHKLVVTGLWISLSFAVSRLLSGAVRAYANQLTATAQAASLTENLVRIAVLGMGAMLVLSNLGVSITPILTALGVGSLAVALALQNPLSNLFAGIQIVATRVARTAHYIRLESGQEGFVVDVGWSATRIRDLSNNLIIIPNAKLIQAVITNYSEPYEELAVSVPLAVAYGCDLSRVERAALETAREVQTTVVGAVASFEPIVRFSAFGESAVQFSAVLKARAFGDRFLLIHEFIKRVHERFRREGFEVPYPRRVVSMRDAP